MGDHLLANLTQAVSVSGESIAVEIYPKSGLCGVAGPNSVAEGRRTQGEVGALLCLGVVIRASHSDNYGKMCGAPKCGSFHVADHRHPGLGVT